MSARLAALPQPAVFPFALPVPLPGYGSFYGCRPFANRNTRLAGLFVTRCPRSPVMDCRLAETYAPFFFCTMKSKSCGCRGDGWTRTTFHPAFFSVPRRTVRSLIPPVRRCVEGRRVERRGILPSSSVVTPPYAAGPHGRAARKSEIKP